MWYQKYLSAKTQYLKVHSSTFNFIKLYFLGDSADSEINSLLMRIFPRIILRVLAMIIIESKSKKTENDVWILNMLYQAHFTCYNIDEFKR